jgi:hypothetical protein
MNFQCEIADVQYILEDNGTNILYNGSDADKMYKKMLEKEGRYKSYSFKKIDNDEFSAELTEWDVFKDETVNQILEMDTATLHLCRREVVEGLEEILKRSSGGGK